MAPDTGVGEAATLDPRSRPGPTGVTLDPTTRHAILPDGAHIRLTPLQFAVLAYLIARAGRPCSRAAIMCEALGYGRPVGSRTVDMHVASLRSKLGRAVPIRAVRGVGYLVPRPDSRGITGGTDGALSPAG